MMPLQRILLIDDDPDDQLFFRDAIRIVQPEIQCDLASSCKQAFSLLEKPPPPDFIFMDLNMPVMNGFECLAYLKSQEKFRDIPMVIFTTSKNPADISRTRQLGAKWYMTKPDDFNLLCKKIKKITGQEFAETNYTI